MRARERVKVVEEGSWKCCGTKKRHERAGAAAGSWRHAWWLRAMVAGRGGEKLAGVGLAAGGRAGGPGGAGRAARGSWQPGRSPARGCGRRSRATERKGREADDGDLFAIFQKFKGFTVK
jgi:hypothetical protein